MSIEMHLNDAIQKYDSVSGHYDRVMDIVFGVLLNLERHRERVIGLIGDIEGGTVIDVGCGTGRNLPLLVSKIGARGRIIGIDCSRGMLELAERRAQQHGWGNVELLLGDAVELRDVREPVDAIVSVWCYGTVYDLDAALNRAIDVLRPGGRIAIMTFARAWPVHGPLRWLYPLYRALVRRAGIDPSGQFEDAALRAKWNRGRALLHARLEELHEETYLQGAGLIIAGRKPAEVARVDAALASEQPRFDRLGETSAA